jgi:RNA polymerase sigma-70 factor (ECF subfamily)
MQLTILRPRAELDGDSDESLVELARLGGENAIRTLIKRNNQRLFRVARSVLRDDFEAEDVVQETYLKAFTKLATFRGDSRFSTWLTRIALNEAIGRKRRARPTADVAELDAVAFANGGSFPIAPLSLTPLAADNEVMRMEIRNVLECAIDDLPEGFRIVFMLRSIEGMSVEETGNLLSLNSNTVKTRLHRAHRLLRTAIEKHFSATFSDIFPFDGVRCIGMADRVVERLQSLPHRNED